MRRTLALGVALALVMALAPAAIAAAPAAKGPPKAPVIGLVVAGQLTDPGYNPLALKGVKEAAAIIGAKVMTAEAKDESAYARAITTVVRRGASVVVTVGFLLADATRAGAGANPSVQFIGVDQWQETTIGNLQALTYNQAQAGFLAGVVAGLVTSGTIGTIGGTDFVPAVLDYMNGYANGAAWVTEPDPSVLAAFAGTYQDPAVGYDITNGMIDEGADVIFGVAGLTTYGVLEAACDRGVWGIGVDYDMWAQHPEYRACTITSAELRIADTVSAALVRWSVGGPLEPGMYLNDAANNGITWSPIRNYVAPATLVAALHTAYAGLADGSINPCSPTACLTVP